MIDGDVKNLAITFGAADVRAEECNVAYVKLLELLERTDCRPDMRELILAGKVVIEKALAQATALLRFVDAIVLTFEKNEDA